jgi:triosephosphate isomerase
MKYLVANWKATKNIKEAFNWVEIFNSLVNSNELMMNSLKNKDLKIIICPSHHLIYPVREKIIKDSNISIGAQDVSFFDKGNYTGEVSAQNLINMVEYCIVGHSERRKYLKETNNMIDQKINLLKDYDIEPILCVRNEKDIVFNEAKIVTYEPVDAIASGNNEPLDDILNMKKKLHIDIDTLFFYGGSVNGQAMKEYRNSSEINGYLVGTASKDPYDFINTALSYVEK